MNNSRRHQHVDKWVGALGTCGVAFVTLFWGVDVPLDSALVSSSGAGLAYLTFAAAHARRDSD